MKSTVVSVFYNDGEKVGMTVVERNVYRLADGTPYIIQLGSRRNVVEQEDGTFLNESHARRI